MNSSHSLFIHPCHLLLTIYQYLSKYAKCHLNIYIHFVVAVIDAPAAPPPTPFDSSSAVVCRPSSEKSVFFPILLCDLNTNIIVSCTQPSPLPSRKSGGQSADDKQQVVFVQTTRRASFDSKQKEITSREIGFIYRFQNVGRHQSDTGLVQESLLEGGNGADAGRSAVLRKDNLCECYRCEYFD